MVGNKKTFLIPIIISTLLAVFSALAITISYAPDEAGNLTLLFLYVSIFLAILGFSTIVGTLLKQKLSKEGLYTRHLLTSFRQGVLLSLFFVVSLFLSANGLLYWWVGGSLILCLIFAEIFFSLKI